MTVPPDKPAKDTRTEPTDELSLARQEIATLRSELEMEKVGRALAEARISELLRMARRLRMALMVLSGADDETDP